MLKLDGDFVPALSEKVGLFRSPPFIPDAMLTFEYRIQPSGNESLVERWILQKLDSASIAIHNDLTDRNFMAATADAYNFWLYEICDVYIVSHSLFH